MAFAQSTGSHEYWYDPDKKEFVLTLFKTDEDGKDHTYLSGIAKSITQNDLRRSL